MSKAGESIKTFWVGVKGVFMAILKGQLLAKLHIDQYVLHIIWVFVLFTGMIVFNIVVENTLSEVENNKERIRELNAIITDKQYMIRSLESQGALEDKLIERGSELRKPAKPANVIR